MTTVAGSHNAALVALSILVATVASYTALDLAARIRAAQGWACHAWLLAAAVAMGGGIWSMHFVAMLAFRMPGMEVHYHLGLTLVSLILPILVTGLGFFIVSRRRTGSVLLAVSGLFMGLGIVTMHYAGMAAMEMAADLRYDPLWVAISVLIAIGTATVALWIAFRDAGLKLRLVAAVAMGLAISGMHYAAMEAAVFSAHTDGGHVHGQQALEQTALGLAVAGTTFLILFLALIAAMFDRRFALLAEREATALRRSEEHARTLYRRTPVPLHSLNHEGIIEHVSDAWLSMMGYRREEVLSRPLINFMAEESARRRIQQDMPEILARGEAKEVAYRFVTKSGEVRDVLVSANVERDQAGNVTSILGGLVDVTERKKAEEALRQAQKTEALGQLTGGVAHDFNNLLAIVLGNLELLRKRLPNDPKLLQMVENAIQGAKRGAVLTQRMLAFARRQDLKPEPVDVPNLIRGMGDLLQRSVGPMIEIETRFALDLPRAQVDANQLELALLNLAVNARDAMPDGGTVTIAAREQVVGKGQVSGLAPGHYVCVSVVDTGEGMDEAVLTRALEPFFTTKGVGKGTGLGLPMVQGLAEQSGGGVVLRSWKGKGTTVEIWLPVTQNARRPSQEAASPQSPPEPLGRGLTILVVDDDALVLRNTSALLEDLGHRVIEASSGQQALNLLRADPRVDLVVADQAMPEMTGIQLARAIWSEWPHLPVLLATGYADLHQETDINVVRLHKPFDQDGLAQAIAECLRRHTKPGKVVPFRPRQG